MYKGIKVIQCKIVPGGLILTLADKRTVYCSHDSEV